MSRAFVKETAQDAPPPERMLSEGPNPVTPEGFAQIEGEVARLEAALKSEGNPLLRETLERDLRYWSAQKLRAQIVSVAPEGGAVAFGARVTITRRVAPAYERKQQTFRIVGEDEARPAAGTISWRSPLAQAIMGAEVGDIVETASPPAEIEIVAID
ncbi:MAG TPA: GreA/GreB family elongation factor [Rhizomicrobium sp.]|nr:GreA/GreB family elongation factor [Rhizomicrobium sp.]